MLEACRYFRSSSTFSSGISNWSCRVAVFSETLSRENTCFGNKNTIQRTCRLFGNPYLNLACHVICEIQQTFYKLLLHCFKLVEMDTEKF